MKLFKTHAAVIAAIALIGGGAAWAQSTTVLGPSITSVSTGVNGTLNALAANASRKALTVCNNDASNKVTITTGTVSPVSLTTGLVLLNGNVASSCATFGQPGGPTSGGVGAQVNIIANGSSTVVTFIEYY